jgi:hypothetical protein
MSTERRKPQPSTRASLGDQARGRAPYVAPALESLGKWSTLTLQQTVPITMLPQMPPDRHAEDVF